MSTPNLNLNTFTNGVQGWDIGMDDNLNKVDAGHGTAMAAASAAQTAADAAHAAITIVATGSNPWPAMTGLDYWLPLTNGSTADASGNNKPGVLGGDATTPAVWLGNVGVSLGSQTLTIANANGRPTNGVCAHFPATGSSIPNFGGNAAGGQASFVLSPSYGIGTDHGADAFFPRYGQSNGGESSDALDGISGVHCIELVAGDGGDILDIIVIDGVEAQYLYHGSGSVQWTGGSQLTNAIIAAGGTFYSMWAAPTRDTVEQACARTKSEMARLTSLGVNFGNASNPSKTDSVITVTGTSIDQGFQASATPISRVVLPFPASVYNLSISGQAAKDMDAGYEDREGQLFNARGVRNIAYHGGVTNSLINYQVSPANGLQDVLAWNRKAKAQGYKTIVSTMMSRIATGYSNESGDALAQEFNASLLAFGDEFDAVANFAADPILGATGAGSNTTYFADGTHLNDTGQPHYVAILQAAINGVYGNPATVVGGNYTQLDTDRVIIQTSNNASTITLKNANCMSFNKAGRLVIKNAGTGILTVTGVSAQTINGAASVTLAAGNSTTLYPYVADASVGGAVWVTL